MKTFKIRNLSFYYNEGSDKRYILKNIHADFLPGKMYCIVGESGSGKSTLLSLMGGLETMKEGDIVIDDVHLSSLAIEDYRAHYVSTVFQDYNLIDYLNAVENIEVALDISSKASNEAKQTLIKDVLLQVGITEDKWKRRVSKLSGGERQRVALARALASDTPIILADEPTGNLDGEMETGVINLFRDLADKYQKCVVIVTHSDKVAENADVVYHLAGGALTVRQ